MNATIDAAIAQHTAPAATTPAAAAEVHDPEVGLGRAYAIGSAVGFVAVFLVCGAICLIAGVEPGAALGAAAFTGFWGGPGFGGMMGAVLHLERPARH